MAARAEYIRVRLVPSTLGNPTEIKVSSEEKDRLLVVAVSNGFGQPGPFIRELGVAAAKKHHARAAREVTADRFKATVIERAAAEANMKVGEWLRTIAMAATGLSALAEQLNEAIATLKVGLPKDGDE